jgi:hypothetical protein
MDNDNNQIMGYQVGPNAPKVRSASTDIAAQIATLITQYDADSTASQNEFKTLVVSYFKRESLEIQEYIEPHLREKLRNSDGNIKEILEKDDRKALEDLVHRLITESIEDAFRGQTDQFAELKELADNRLKKAHYALATAIVTGVFGALGIFFGVYFGHN